MCLIGALGLMTMALRLAGIGWLIRGLDVWNDDRERLKTALDLATLRLEAEAKENDRRRREHQELSDKCSDYQRELTRLRLEQRNHLNHIAELEQQLRTAHRSPSTRS